MFFLFGSLLDFCFVISFRKFTRTYLHECFSLSIKSRTLRVFSVSKLWVSSAEEESSLITHFKIIFSSVFPFALGMHIIANSVPPGSSPKSHLFSHWFTSLLVLCSESFSVCFPVTSSYIFNDQTSFQFIH